MGAPDEHDALVNDPGEAQRERERRERALRELARGVSASVVSSAQSPTSSDVVSRQHVTTRTRLRVYLASALALTLVIGAAAGIAYWRHPFQGPTQARPSSTVTFSPRVDHIECIHDVAWSPSGDQVALLGYESGCPDFDNPGPPINGLLLIIDARHGGLLSSLNPDQLIVPHIATPPKVVGRGYFMSGINYTHAFWLPDERHLALTFTVRLVTGPFTATGWPQELIEGVLLIDTQSRHAQVFHRTQRNLSPSLIEWDLTTGKSIPLSPALVSHTPQATITPASAYLWGAGGSLTPQAPLPLNAVAAPPPASTGAVGMLDGGRSFSIWQPGVFSSQIAPNTVGRLPLGGYNFSTTLDALSPEGRYLVEGANVSMLVALPSAQPPAPADLASYGWAHAPRIQARDSALREHYRDFASHAFGFGLNGVLVAWSPDGRYLAVDGDTADHHVTVYDTRTGATVRQLIPGTNNVPPGNRVGGYDEINALRWSPDSKRLLLLDTAYGLVTIWNL